MIEYFIHSTLFLGTVYLIYQLMLKNTKAFQFNRIFLLTTLLLTLILPLIEFEIQAHDELDLPLGESTNFFKDEQKAIENQKTVEVVDTNHSPLLSFQNIYLLGILLLSARFLYRLFYLIQLINKKGTKKNGLVFISTKEETVFSFFNYIFIPKNDIESTIPAELIEHEKVHARQLHSLDLIFSELACMIAWINPFVWMMKRSIEQNHEFIADDKVGKDKGAYCSILLNSSKGKQLPLISGFSYQSLKKRIKMIYRNKPSKQKIMKKISIALTITIIAVVFSSFQNIHLIKPYTVIIDAGHGGKDKGAISETVYEADLSLLYAQLISKKLEAKGIKVIQLRENDQFIELNERVRLANQYNADLLLSLHLNYTSPSQFPNKKGMELYISNKYIQGCDTNYRYKKIMNFASVLNQNYEGELKVLPAPFTILRESNCASALIELGFISNKEEKAKLVSQDYQDELSTLIAVSVVNSLN